MPKKLASCSRQSSGLTDGGPNSQNVFAKCRVKSDFQIAGNVVLYELFSKKIYREKRAPTVRNRVGISAIELIGRIAHSEKLRKCCLIVSNL